MEARTIMTKGYNSWGSCDILAETYRGKPLGAICRLTYEISKEPTLIHSLYYEAEKREITGTLSFMKLYKILEDKKTRSKMFNISLVAANEHGAKAVMKLIGVRLFDSNGKRISLADVYRETEGNNWLLEQILYTYDARRLIPWSLEKPKEG
jgi:hypothetical protein